VNVVALMKRTMQLYRRRRNGGIIYPELHYGRDSLVGVALFFNSFWLIKKMSVSALRASYQNIT
jgi:phosphomannomutase